MHVTTENHGDLSCEIEINTTGDCHIGTLKHTVFQVGLIFGPDLAAVNAQFQAIC